VPTVCLQSVFELVNSSQEKRLTGETSAIHRNMRSTRGPGNALTALLWLTSEQGGDFL